MASASSVSPSLAGCRFTPSARPRLSRGSGTHTPRGLLQMATVWKAQRLVHHLPPRSGPSAPSTRPALLSLSVRHSPPRPGASVWPSRPWCVSGPAGFPRGTQLGLQFCALRDHLLEDSPLQTSPRAGTESTLASGCLQCWPHASVQGPESPPASDASTRKQTLGVLCTRLLTTDPARGGPSPGCRCRP